LRNTRLHGVYKNCDQSLNVLYEIIFACMLYVCARVCEKEEGEKIKINHSI